MAMHTIHVTTNQVRAIKALVAGEELDFRQTQLAERLLKIIASIQTDEIILVPKIQAFIRPPENTFYKYVNQNKVWRSSNGKEIPITELNYHHLKNCIDFLVEKRNTMATYFPDMPTGLLTGSPVAWRGFIRSRPLMVALKAELAGRDAANTAWEYLEEGDY